MAKDPIVEDVRFARQKLFDACNEDLNALLDRFQAQETLDQERIISDTSSQVRREPGTVQQHRAGSSHHADGSL